MINHQKNVISKQSKKKAAMKQKSWKDLNLTFIRLKTLRNNQKTV